MNDKGTPMRMVGMIPMPEAQYASAMSQCLDGLRRAMTPLGLNATNLVPPPSRMMPVVQDEAGNHYVLAETCNANHRPTAVPLSAFFPSASGAGSTPSFSESDGFIPLAALENIPSPPADQDLQAAGNSATGLLSKLLETLPQVKARSWSGGGAPTAGVDSFEPKDSKLSPLAVAASRMKKASPLEMTSLPLGSSLSSEPPTLPSPLHQPMESKSPTAEETTRSLLSLAKAEAKAGGRPDATGGLSSMILGVTAAQNPKASSTSFEKMLAEKAAGFTPTGGIYRRLQTALAALPPTSVSEG